MARGRKLEHGFGLRHEKYRNQCYAYIKENGPSTANTMYESVRNARGNPYRLMPSSVESLHQLLRRDKRFYSDSKVKVWDFTGAKAEHMLWKIKEGEQ
tara:strand:+ start:291 stop:584 length:294 start_codon:yes stop_codon:yes gene_type:complete